VVVGLLDPPKTKITVKNSERIVQKKRIRQKMDKNSDY